MCQEKDAQRNDQQKETGETPVSCPRCGQEMESVLVDEYNRLVFNWGTRKYDQSLGELVAFCGECNQELPHKTVKALLEVTDIRVTGEASTGVVGAELREVCEGYRIPTKHSGYIELRSGARYPTLMPEEFEDDEYNTIIFVGGDDDPDPGVFLVNAIVLQFT